MRTIIQDMRYGLRVLRKAPGFTAVAVITLALGIGVNAAMFAVFSAFLLRPLPFRDPQRLIVLWEKRPGMQASLGERFPLPLEDYRKLREQAHSLQQVGLFESISPRMATPSGSVKLEAATASANLLDVLGTSLPFGRSFSEQETQPGQNRVVVVSHEFASEYFGSPRAAIGRGVTLDGEGYEIIGVLPPAFRMPNLSEGQMQTIPQVILPLDTASPMKDGRFFFGVIARLNPGVSVQQASAELSLLARQFKDVDVQGLTRLTGVNVFSLRVEDRSPGIARQLMVFQFAVGFILLIACANIANLLLARATLRKKEVAVRLALGATRNRIIGQLLTESVTLGLMGGAAGLLLANWLIDLITRLAPEGFLEAHHLSIDPHVFAFSFGAALLASVLFGLAPAFHTLRQKIHEALSQTGRSLAGQGNKTRAILVVSELSLALTLLVGAGLMVRTMQALRNVDAGFRTDHLLTAALQLPLDRHENDKELKQHVTAFSDQLLNRLRTLPGVQSATIASSLPMSMIEVSTFHLEGQPESQLQSADMSSVRDDYFKTMGIPIVKGREFTRLDVQQKSHAVILSESLARRLWPGQDPIGRVLMLDKEHSSHVIGVARDTHEWGLDAPGTPTIYRIASVANPIVVLHTRGDPRQLVKPLVEQVAALDKDVPVSDVQSGQGIIHASMKEREFHMWLFIAFAGLAITLAGIGQYGVLTYIVSMRTREIGIRMALGAQVKDVLRMVIRQGLTLAALAVVIGLAAAVALARLMSSFVFGVKTLDPLTYAITAGMLVLVAGFACFVPARRAARVDPMVALRYE